jgi:CubicO group peptidase (beta-lactamase class C family)
MARVRAFILILLLGAPVAVAQTGTPTPTLSALDDIMQQALVRYSVHGGALAVVKDGRLVFARGYGLADVEAQQPTQPQSLFRWESMSKTVTAAAVMRLAEDGKINLDSPIFTLLNQYSPYSGRWADSRLFNITIRQVLHHTGGWDRMISPQMDPVDGEGTVQAARNSGSGFPPSIDTVIRYMLAQRLDFNPGDRSRNRSRLRCVLESTPENRDDTSTRYLHMAGPACDRFYQWGIS